MKQIVTIQKVGQYTVSYEGLSADISYFPDAKVGQKWEVETSTKDPNYPRVVFPLGVILNTKLIEDV